MSEKPKKNLEIPVLMIRKDYRTWSHRLETHLRSKEMINFIKYEFMSPVLLNEVRRNGNVLRNFRGRNYPDDILRIPGRLPDEIQTLAAQTAEGDIEFYFEEQNGPVPDDFFHLVCDGVVMLLGSKLYLLMESRNEWKKRKRLYIKNLRYVENLFHTTVSLEKVHLFTNAANFYEGYQAIKNSFVKANRLEQAQIIGRLTRLPFKYLRQYTDNFDF